MTNGDQDPFIFLNLDPNPNSLGYKKLNSNPKIKDRSAVSPTLLECIRISNSVPLNLCILTIFIRIFFLYEFFWSNGSNSLYKNFNFRGIIVKPKLISKTNVCLIDFLQPFLKRIIFYFKIVIFFYVNIQWNKYFETI